MPKRYQYYPDDSNGYWIVDTYKDTVYGRMGSLWAVEMLVDALNEVECDTVAN